MTIAYYADLGTINFADMLKIHRELVDMRHTDQIKDMLLFSEHNPAILFGHEKEKNSFSDQFVKELMGRSPEEHLRNLGVTLHDGTKHAESATYVGPGQLFICPINDYTRLFKPYDTTKYNALVNNAIADVMKKFGLEAQVSEDMINMGNTILGSKRFHMTHKVASHSFHVHVNAVGTDGFWMIHPYGSPESKPISMEDLTERSIDMNEVKKASIRAIKKNFGYRRLEECNVTLDDEKVTVKK